MGRPASFEFRSREQSKSLHGETADKPEPCSTRITDMNSPFALVGFISGGNDPQTSGSSRSSFSQAFSLSRRSSSNYGDEGRAALYDYVSRRSQELEALNQKLSLSGAPGTEPAYAARAREDSAVAQHRTDIDVQFQSCRDLSIFFAADLWTPEEDSAALPWEQMDFSMEDPYERLLRTPRS
mmetsp:Transcript_9094/g.16394  ORF Transcript_9094/g.16394 Transcript_9094/m.16394 type:complete len:182 (-) Transcript_9094:226-771(-)|eukprot:CAMPEP_0177751812 /NCGR_PEP_ID=MMETSP0491_2-20121128/583_1 /TAXON_ID=63592 /ORGANISM="Tetraselmis chuii, Strain PLY429" /LENGTH=181 /DNA_ID=CAMNT_0019266969 /DNA_START=260 /DNA_END=805 /DNA_ORIENTATION=-